MIRFAAITRYFRCFRRFAAYAFDYAMLCERLIFYEGQVW